ncbi:protein IQ-DOMAIN 14-like [Ipomoea triloba]|uniref:protein IQ-DOMAIN 14-like n=1 Tax=Ipomoea triloba TaxID=35885 RepID=UPI00125D5DE5|nr:protein IQ-DOMAIN 14-like [Ipomoea triloba]
MGKASRWIRNFLMGKKEKDNKDEGSVSAASLGASPAIVPSSSKVKRRWSFKRSSSSDSMTHNSIRSFDSALTAQLKAQASLLEFEILQNHAKAFLAARNEAAKTAAVEVEAAIRIQAAFRSYLARKALRALRSLVKLQALVRGHLVRKQTADMIRCLHSLMAIQLRARVQRAHIADETEFPFKKRTIHKDSAPRSQLINRTSNTEYMSSHEKESISRRRSLHKNRGHGTNGNGLTSSQTGRHSISEREHQRLQSICPSPSTFSEISTITFDRPLEELSDRLSQRGLLQSPKPGRTKQPIPRSESMNYMFPDSRNASYMSNTESSRAKARSQSEPRQRPKWGIKKKHIRTPSVEGLQHDSEIEGTPSNMQGCNDDFII